MRPTPSAIQGYLANRSATISQLVAEFPSDTPGEMRKRMERMVRSGTARCRYGRDVEYFGGIQTQEGCMKIDCEDQGYSVGATVRQYHHDDMYDDAVIVAVHANGALDVEKDGVRYGWSVRTCKPILTYIYQ